jgi:hypothetical protein
MIYLRKFNESSNFDESLIKYIFANIDDEFDRSEYQELKASISIDLMDTDHHKKELIEINKNGKFFLEEINEISYLYLVQIPNIAEDGFVSIRAYKTLYIDYFDITFYTNKLVDINYIEKEILSLRNHLIAEGYDIVTISFFAKGVYIQIIKISDFKEIRKYFKWVNISLNPNDTEYTSVVCGKIYYVQKYKIKVPKLIEYNDYTS